MSRAKRLAHSLVSGYVLLGANTIYALASLPLALRYLSKPEFALWGLTMTIAQYIGLIDLGMAGASRIMIDYKDEKQQGNYGSVIQTFLLVSVVQGAVIVILGVALAAGLVPVLHIPAEQQRQFVFLTIGQCGLLAGSFLTRILSYLLAAHQRYDVTNYCQAISFAANFGLLWLGFAHHQGVYSTLWAQSASWIIGAALSLVWVIKMNLLPGRGCWGRPTWGRFRELFNYGRDVFLFAMGFQLLNASQVAILTRLLGLETAAVWTICTRTYTMISQLIYRIFDYSAPALAEMIVRGEQQRLYHRFKSLVILSGSASVAVGIIFAVTNQPFVRWWLGPNNGWPQVNDALLGAWLVLLTVARCHLGLVGQAKQFGAMRYLFLAEGAFFVGMSLLVVPRGGISAMFLASIAGTLFFSSPYGIWRTSRYFDVAWQKPGFDWWLPPLRLALGLIPFAAIVAWLAAPLPPAPRCLVCAGVTGFVAVPLLFRFGIEPELRDEFANRFPKRFSPLLLFLGGRRTLLK